MANKIMLEKLGIKLDYTVFQLMDETSEDRRTRTKNKKHNDELRRIEEFLNTLGKMSPASQDRDVYLFEQAEMKDELLVKLFFWIYPEFNPDKYIDEKQIIDHEVHSDILKIRYEYALKKWTSAGGKAFHHYVLDTFVQEAYMEKEKSDTNGFFTSQMIRVAWRAQKLVREEAISPSEAFETLQKFHNDDTIYGARAYFNKKYSLKYLSGPIDTEESSTVEAMIDTFIEAENSESEFRAVEDMAELEFAIGQKLVETYCTIRDATVAKRAKLQCAHTGWILRLLKYDEGATKPISMEPAGKKTIYLAYRKYRDELMNGILEKGLIEFLICERPQSLNTLEGIYYNLFREGCGADYASLAAYTHKSEPGVRDFLNRRNIFLGTTYRKKDKK